MHRSLNRPNESDGMNVASSNEVNHNNAVNFNINIDKIREKRDEFFSLRMNNQYNSFLEQFSDSILIIDPETAAFIAFNEKAHTLLEYTRSEFEKLTIFDIEAIETVEETRQNIARLISKEEASFITQQCTKSGKILDIEVKAKLIEIDGNQYFQCIWSDITELEEAKRLLLKKEQDFKNLFNSMLEGVYLHEMVYDEQNNPIDYKIIDGNPISEKLLKIKLSDAIGKLATELYNLETAPYLDIYSKVAQTGIPTSFEEYFEPMDTYFRISVFSPERGKFATVFMDITKSKRTEKELIKAKEKAEENDRLKTAFLANMSHEIRTPLNGILGFTDLLGTQDLDANKISTYIDIIKKSGKRLLETVNDIIEMSKIETGLLELHPSKFNLIKEIEDLVQFFSPEAEKLNTKIRFNKTIPEIYLISDCHKIQGIIINLVKNAIKFTKDGFIDIIVEESPKQWKVSVRDTGKGISHLKLKSIFNRFEQANSLITRGHEGSGLGLSISKAYVELLNGEIGVESELGVGSNFWFTLPKLSSDKLEGDKKENSHQVQDNTKEAINILVAEDDEISYLFLQNILNKPHHKLTRCVNGKEIVEKIDQLSQYDIILMDIKMPLMDGYTATREIRKVNKEIPIIAQTGFAMEGDEEEALDAGCNAYITKPINRKRLIDLIHSYVG